MLRVVLSVPKRVGRKTVMVSAVVSDEWHAVCNDAAIAARLDSLKPAWPLGYLPAPTLEWARAAEQALKARVVKIEEPSGGPVPGVVMGSL